MADAPSTPAPPTPAPTGDPPPKGDESELGDKGKLALDNERKARRDAEKTANDLAAKLKEIEDRDKSELQKALDAAAEKDRQLAELPKEARRQAIRFASLANQKGFLDPEDALVFVDVDLSDEAAVGVALDELAARKPHLLRGDAPPPAQHLPAKPKPKGGGPAADPKADGKARAAAALRQFRSTR